MNTKIIEEIHDIFERMHARLDYRFQQLIRQVNRKSKLNSLIKKNQSEMFVFISEETTFSFSPINQIQLEENIHKFGRLTVSTSLNNIERCESVCMHLTLNHSCLFSFFFYTK
jgi:hypothetical protein